MSIKNLWVETYRPSKLDEYVWSDAAQKEQVMSSVRDGNIPNLLLSGSAGVGKTTLARCLFNELGVDYYRNLTGFVETMPSGDYRYILLDECLDEDTVVWVLRNGTQTEVAIKDLDQLRDLVKSYSVENQRIEWRPFELMDKGDREVLEIEFENGEVIICTPNHKWYVKDLVTGETKVVCAAELDQYEHILTI